MTTPVSPSAAVATLAARLREPTTLAALRARWVEGRRLRIPDALAPGLADAIVAAAGAQPFAFFERHVSEVHCVFWRQVQALTQAPTTFAPIAALRQLLLTDLPALASAITGQKLHASDADGFAIDYYTRGSYLDAHTDQGADRLVAFVIGLTREAWPAEDGGHLEFLEADERTVQARVAPGWGSIDLFCVYPLLQPHRIPILTRPVTRLSINGWLGGELYGPGEAP